MSAELLVRSDVSPISWDTFVSTHPAGSIALDGYVAEGPNFDPAGPFYNANHHEGVNRLATLSTAQQILMGIRMGLDKAFVTDGLFAPKVFVNDTDQDVCAAWYLLNNVDQTRNPSPALNRFINVAGTLDATAGAFPYDRDLRILGELAWVFEPHTRFRASGEMARKDNEQYRSVIQDVQARIALHLIGRGESAMLDTRYGIIGGGKDWTMIEETGKDGRVGALVDGVNAYVSVQYQDSGRWRYTVGARSEFIPFAVTRILEELNSAEGCTDDCWGDQVL